MARNVLSIVPGDTTTSSTETAGPSGGHFRAPAPESQPLFFVDDDTTTMRQDQEQAPYPGDVYEFPHIPKDAYEYPPSHVPEDEDEAPDAPHAFGIEKGFWKISSAAQELLKFAAIYQATPSTGPSADRRLPKEIDMLSMMQLSWSVLHAVGDINSHNQRLQGLAERSRRGPVARAARKKRRRAEAEAQHHRGGPGCIECGAAESPCWRMGPAGPLTLCNVCGLLFAKRSEVAATIRGDWGEEGSSGG